MLAAFIVRLMGTCSVDDFPCTILTPWQIEGWSSLLLVILSPGFGETKARHRYGFFMEVAILASSEDDPDDLVTV